MLNLSFPCLFHLATGYYCPGCGGTRAIASLSLIHNSEPPRHCVSAYAGVCV